MRARLAFAWAAVHGLCTLREEMPGNPLWHREARAAEVAEDVIALLVVACTGARQGRRSRA